MKIKETVTEKDLDFLYDCLIFTTIVLFIEVVIAEIFKL